MAGILLPARGRCRRLVNYVTLEADGDRTIVTWEERFDGVDVATMSASYEKALTDIGERLIARFGGHVLDR